MRTLIFALALIASGSSFASMADQLIYNSLNVKEESQQVSRAQLKTLKSVGGLTCIKTNDIFNGDVFTCSLNMTVANSTAIYNALNVEAGTLPAGRTELKYIKTVAGLTCIATNNNRYGNSTTCTLAF